MTSRTLTNEKLKKIGVIVLCGVGVFFLGAVFAIWRGGGPPPIISFVGIGAAMVAIIYAQFGIKCPHCNNSWGYIAMYKGFEFNNPFKIFTVSKKIKYCPFCGVDIDKEL